MFESHSIFQKKTQKNNSKSAFGHSYPNLKGSDMVYFTGIHFSKHTVCLELSLNIWNVVFREYSCIKLSDCIFFIAKLKCSFRMHNLVI